MHDPHRSCDRGLTFRRPAPYQIEPDQRHAKRPRPARHHEKADHERRERAAGRQRLLAYAVGTEKGGQHQSDDGTEVEHAGWSWFEGNQRLRRRCIMDER